MTLSFIWRLFPTRSSQVVTDGGLCKMGLALWLSGSCWRNLGV